MTNPTVLVVDFDPCATERVRHALNAAGYRVEVAGDGLSGIETFHRVKPDLVLIEALLPKKSGFEVCQELKTTPLGQRTPILIVTAFYKGNKYRMQGLHIYGCDEYVERPIAHAQLIATCERFLGSGSRNQSKNDCELSCAS